LKQEWGVAPELQFSFQTVELKVGGANAGDDWLAPAA